MRTRLEGRKITLELTEAARNFIADNAYDPVYGARPLRRYLQQRIETTLARKLVGGELREGQHVVIDVVTEDDNFEDLQFTIS